MSLSVITGELVNEDDSDHGVCVCVCTRVFSVLKKNKLRLSVGKWIQKKKKEKENGYNRDNHIKQIKPDSENQIV